jgi:NADPH:quinone reductase
MKAIVIDDSLPDRPLRLREVPEPEVGANDLLVSVKAAGLNRADLRRAASHFSSSEKSSLNVAGLELAGEVIALGKDVAGFSVGDRVMAMASNAYAEKAVLDHRLAIRVPPAFTWEQAAATPITFVTAHDALTAAGRFKAGETVLIQGASTGAGIAAVQCVRWLGAGHVFGTAGKTLNLARLQEIGCTTPIDYRNGDIPAVIQQHTNGAGVDLVIDIVGGDMAQVNVDCAAISGRIVCLGRVSGTHATLNLDEFSRKRITMVGITFRTRSLAERIDVIKTFNREVVPALESGDIAPVVDMVFPLQKAGDAQEYMRENRHFGKIILRV